MGGAYRSMAAIGTNTVITNNFLADTKHIILATTHSERCVFSLATYATVLRDSSCWSSCSLPAAYPHNYRVQKRWQHKKLFLHFSVLDTMYLWSMMNTSTA